MFDWVLNTPVTTHYSPFLSKRYVSFSSTSHLCQYSIDIRTNIAGHKYKWTQKFENIHNFIKCTSYHIYNMLQCEIYSPLSSNKTAQRNSQHFTMMHNEVRNMLHNKIYWKLISVFSFVKQAKNKADVRSWVLQLIVKRFH